jgi:hypothetical protein
VNQLRGWQRWFGRLRRPSRPRREVFARPIVEGLEERAVPTANTWIASGSAPADWNVASNWSFESVPQAGQDVVFQVNGSQGTAPCTLEQTTPELASVTFAANWNQTLSLMEGTGTGTGTGTGGTQQGAPGGGQQGTPTFGVLITDAMTLNARTGSSLPTYTISVAASCAVNCYQNFVFDGGGIGGAGSFQVKGALTVGGTSSADKPTLGIGLGLGDGITTTTMGYSGNTVPLVVRDSGNITVNTYATLDFSGALPALGQTAATAISSADNYDHVLTIAGGTAQVKNNVEDDVAMTVDITNGGLLDVETDGTVSPDDAGPLVFTAVKPTAMTVDYGSTSLKKDASFNGGLEITAASGSGGVNIGLDTNVSFDGDITVGSNAEALPNLAKLSCAGTVSCTGTLYVGSLSSFALVEMNSAIINADGGVQMSVGGCIDTGSAGTTNNQIFMSSGTFTMSGGEFDVTLPKLGVGSLTINGDMTISGGIVVINCDSTNMTSGSLTVNGTLTLTNGNTAKLRAKDINHAAGGITYDAIQSCSDGGGDFSAGDLPPTGSGRWLNNNTIFQVWS